VIEPVAYTRRKEKSDEDAWRLSLENQLRRVKVQPVLTSIEQLDAAQEDDETLSGDGTRARGGDLLAARSASFAGAASGARRQPVVKPVVSPMRRPACGGRGRASCAAWMRARRAITPGAIGPPRRVARLTCSDISSLVEAR